MVASGPIHRKHEVLCTQRCKFIHASLSCAGCRAPGRVVVALGWSSSDEGKLWRSFGVGRADFPAFVDLAEVFRDLGYEGQVRICTLCWNQWDSWKKMRKRVVCRNCIGNTRNETL